MINSYHRSRHHTIKTIKKKFAQFLAKQIRCWLGKASFKFESALQSKNSHNWQCLGNFNNVEYGWKLERQRERAGFGWLDLSSEWYTSKLDTSGCCSENLGLPGFGHWICSIIGIFHCKYFNDKKIVIFIINFKW